MEACGARRDDYVCDYPKGHEHDETRHYYDRYYHHHTLPDSTKHFPAGSFGIEWLVDGAPPKPESAQ